MFIQGETFDDLLKKGLEAVLASGLLIKPKKGDARELIGVTMKLDNPRARFSRTETRATLFSALGETLWYLAGSDDFESIIYYVPRYRDFCETPSDVLRSEAAYGPRLVAQLPFIRGQIQKNDTRKAVLSIYRKEDHENRFDVPCTCSLQFFPRSGVLHALAQMRSNDIFLGMAHDIFAFTFLQELLARWAGLEVGSYLHQVGSLHLYKKDEVKAGQYLDSGVADTVPMPMMPLGNPDCGLAYLIELEQEIRLGGSVEIDTGISPYWCDLVRVLQLKACILKGDLDGMRVVRSLMNTDVFNTFIDDEIAKHDEKRKSITKASS